MASEVTILLDNGEVRLSKFLLASLYTILKNIIQSLGDSNKVQLNGIQREELQGIFQKLFDQVTKFESFENSQDNTLFEDEYQPEEATDNNDEAGFDSMLYYITEGHDNQIPDSPAKEEKDKPIVIPFNKYNKVNEGKTGTQKGTKCDLCDLIIFKRGPGRPGTAEIDEHMSTVHGYEMTECSICHTKLLKINLESHLNKHFKCPICEKRILNKYRLQAHIRYHEKQDEKKQNSLDKNQDYPCPHCGKTVKGIWLRDHIKFKCPKNPELPPKTCEICGHISVNRHYHNIHVRCKHREKKVKMQQVESMCNICGKVFYSKSSLKVHNQAYHEIRELRYKCEVCDKLYATAGERNRHTKLTHKEKSTCPHCGVKVKKLRIHILDAHTKDEDKKYQCPDCGKGFNEKKKMEKHQMNVHLKLKPYSCRYGCDISYNDLSNRNQHEKKKHGKLFTTEREERLKEKIELLGLDKDLLSAPII